MTTIYHNPKCSKSRAGLDLLQKNGADPQIIKYLETPPSKETLKEIITMLKVGPREIMRRGEAIYKELNLDDESLSDDELLEAIVKHPILLERPIVINKGKAAIGRPTEDILKIL